MVVSRINTALDIARVRQKPPRCMMRPKTNPVASAEAYRSQSMSSIARMLSRSPPGKGAEKLTFLPTRCYGRDMPDRFGRIRLRPASGLTLMLAASLGVAACARGTDERARVQADIAALRGDVEQLKNGQETAARERAKLGEQLKAVDAQQAFLVA